MRSDEEAPPITAAQLQSFLDAKRMERPCELCGETKWGIPIAGTDKDTLTMLALGDEMRRFYFPAYLIYCTNCGNTKALEASVIEQWVANNG